jgi:hypothetical protein
VRFAHPLHGYKKLMKNVSTRSNKDWTHRTTLSII